MSGNPWPPVVHSLYLDREREPGDAADPGSMSIGEEMGLLLDDLLAGSLSDVGTLSTAPTRQLTCTGFPPGPTTVPITPLQ